MKSGTRTAILVRVMIVFVILAAHVNGTTRYVRPATAGGSDDSTGTSWATAWATISKVNTSTGSGDAVFFGTGIWRGTTLLPIGGNGTTRTVYACSSFAAVNGNGQYHFAKIWGSEQVTGWTQIGASKVYIANFTTFSTGDLETFYPAGGFQGDSVLSPQYDSSGVDAVGKWWAGNGHVIAWVYNIGGLGYDPDAYDMELTNKEVMVFSRPSGSEDHILVWGLEFKYGSPRVVNFQFDAEEQDSIAIAHCKMSHASGWWGVNPSVLYMGSHVPYHCEFNSVTACSLGSSWAMHGASYGLAGPWYAHGDCMTLYSWSNSLIDSNTFYGFQTVGAIVFKGGNTAYTASPGGTVPHDNVIRYNFFDGSVTYKPNSFAIILSSWQRNTQIYGNVFYSFNNEGRTIILNGYNHFSATSYDTTGWTKIYNNTFYNCKYPIEHKVADDLNGDGSYRFLPHVYDEFKYNVIYRSEDTKVWIWELDSIPNVGRMTLDSNMYYVAPSSSLTFGWKKRNVYTRIPLTLTQWQAAPWSKDVHSTFTTDPVFNNAANRDFSRPSSCREMNRLYKDPTWSGGDTIWTRYGAWQTVGGSPTPKISVTPARLNFDNVGVGLCSNPNLTFTVQNTGGGILPGTATVSAPFSIVSGGTYNLTSCQSQVVTVKFCPTSAGAANQNVTFTGGGGATRAVSGIGTVSTPAISVTPASLSFSNVGVGLCSNPNLTFTVQNIGSDTLSGTATVSAPFGIVSGGTYNLTSNQSQVVTVRFCPTSAGTANQNVIFTGGGGAPRAVSGTGTVSTPTISVTPANLSFGNVGVGLCSNPNLTFTVQNIGSGTLSGTATISAPFGIVSGGTYNLTSNQSQVVTVRFCPTSAGTANQNVIFTGGGGATRAVSGVGNAVPTTPGLSSPVNGGTVTLVAPALVIANSTDPEGDPLVYDFQVAINAAFTTIVAQITGVARGTAMTSWTVNPALSDGSTYYWRSRAYDSYSNSAYSTVGSLTVSTSPGNLGLGILPRVSGTYIGYTTIPITDGIVNPYGGTGTTWASDQDSSVAHWLEIDFGSIQKVRSVIIYWARNATTSSWMTSRQYRLERWNGTSYSDVMTVSNSLSDSLTCSCFSPVNTQKIRIFQPANMGPVSYSGIMWLTELRIFSSDKCPAFPVKDVH